MYVRIVVRTYTVLGVHNVFNVFLAPAGPVCEPPHRGGPATGGRCGLVRSAAFCSGTRDQSSQGGSQRGRHGVGGGYIRTYIRMYVCMYVCMYNMCVCLYTMHCM